MIRLILLLIGAAALAFAQEPRWRAMEGDDPRWAEPGFDDSSWKASTGPTVYVNRGQVDTWYAGVRWYRATFKMPEQPNGQQWARAAA